MTEVVNVWQLRRSGYDWKRDPRFVYIGRPSPWGNPYIIGKDGTRNEVIDKYRRHLLTNADLLARLPDLKGKTLVCYCKPQPCHGDVLVQLLEEA